MNFTDLDLDDCVLDALDAMNFQECTPVQEHAIPLLLEGKDLIGVAQTGTGKTAAYLLPVLNQLSRGEYKEDAINCVIMAPTRELAQQIDQQVEGFSYFMPVSSVAIYGGNDGIRYEQEKKGLALGADIIIATPGRLISHLNLGNVDLSHVSFFILDEADRMLDMGFSDDIMQIVKNMPESRQTILFSATMPDKIATLARNIMHDPVEVRIAVSKPAEKIDQCVYCCREADKTKILLSLFEDKQPERVIVFASSKQKVKDLNILLHKKGLNVAAMHSDLEQKERDEVMLAFKAGRVGLLVATDIVARGIDIDDIRLVVNYDAPRDAEDYVHRIGRTARAGRDGRAVTLVGEKDRPALADIEKLLGEKIRRAPLPEGLTPPSAKPSDGRGRGNDRRHQGGHRRREARGSEQQPADKQAQNRGHRPRSGRRRSRGKGGAGEAKS